MPNAEIVRALVNAFNMHNYARDTVETNFTLQSNGKRSYIVVSFDKSMDTYQCRRYLDSIKRKIIREFYGIEESNDAEILDTAKLIFDVNSFPFDISDRDWSWDKQRGFKFVTPIDEGVIFNLKSHLASSLKKDVLEDMRVSSTTIASNKKKYLWHDEFDSKELCKEFGREFLSRMENRYGYKNVFKNPLKVEGNDVYIEDVFNDAYFIDSVTRHAAWLTGMGFHADSKVRSDVKAFKDLIMRFIDQSTGIMLTGFMCASPLGREEASVLMPIILEDKGARLLIRKEADKLNQAFDDVVFCDVNGRTQAKISVNGSSEVYGIDFSNPYISHCVITKIIENSVINKDHELAIDPELHFRALSPAQSPFNSPTHAGQSGLRTPPNQRKADTESGCDSNSPLQLKDSGSSSGGPGPSSKMSQTQLESPTRSQEGALNDSPMRGSEQGSETEEEGLLLHNHVNLAGTSKGFPPLPQLNSIAVSYGVSGPSKSGGNLGAAAASGSIPGPLLWSQNEPSSSKGANPVGTNPWAQQTNPCLSQGTSENKWISSMQFTKPGPSGLSWSQSGASSSRGAGENMPTGSSSWCLPPSTFSLTTRNDPISSNLGIFADPPEDTENICSMKEKQQVTKEEKNLFKELLYVFNLNNYILEYPNTNFIVENGKIASSIHDGVNVEEYLEELKKFMREKYCGTEEEAYDLNEFPFDFLSNCEKNQETTVVANISRGALSNLKKLFIWEHEGKVEIGDIDIDINIVEKAVKSKKDIWVNSQVQGLGVRPHEAILDCYPDESKLEHILIIKDKGGYYLDRTYGDWEVELFLKERRCAKGTSVAGKGSSKAEEKTSDYYSMSEHTDHEESSPMQQQNSSQNTRGGLPKRRSQSPVGEDSPRKFSRRESNNSSSEEAGGSPRSNFSDSESELCMGFSGANLGRK